MPLEDMFGIEHLVDVVRSALCEEAKPEWVYVGIVDR